MKNAEAAEKKLLASGACGEIHYNDDYEFEADESVQYRLYKDGVTS